MPRQRQETRGAAGGRCRGTGGTGRLAGNEEFILL